MWSIDEALRQYDIWRWSSGRSFKDWLADMEAEGVKMEWK